jgi:hypothetical protein
MFTTIPKLEAFRYKAVMSRERKPSKLVTSVQQNAKSHEDSQVQGFIHLSQAVGLSARHLPG